MKNIFIISVFMASLLSCTTNDRRKVVDATNEKKGKNQTELVQIADLPIQIDSTHYLIHPIGEWHTNQGSSDYYSGSRFNYDYSVSNSSAYRITGKLSNVKFQHKDSTKLIQLTSKNLTIQYMEFLSDFYYNSKKGIFVYTVFDKDTNNDGNLNSNDLKSLYISNLDGTNFRKISKENEDLKTWKFIKMNNSIYFKTIEDTNKDGNFDNRDSMHYYYTDLLLKNVNVAEYFPI